MSRYGLLRRLGEGVTMLVVAAASLALLLYVGFGDGKRTFEQIQIEKLTAQGLYVQNSLEKFVRDGLPLKQYAGFSTLVAPVVEGDEVDGVGVYDQTGKQLFMSADKDIKSLPGPPSSVVNPGDDIKVVYGEDYYRMLLPLRSRFETVGSVVIFAPAKQIAQRIQNTFLPLIYVVLALSTGFSLIVVFGKPFLKSIRLPWLQILYGSVFLIMAGFVVSSLVNLYFDGLQSKARATAFTLSQRLMDIVEFKLDFSGIDGIDRAFRDNRKANPEISETAVIVDGAVEIATDSKIVGSPWVTSPDVFEYKLKLSRAAQPVATEFAITVPVRVVWERVARSVKNFAALFIAAAFLSALFLQVAASLQQRNATSGEDAGISSNDVWLVLIKPVYFLGVFLDSLIYSFLPKYMQEAAAASGLSVGFASAPFTAYYLCFALSLIPSATFCERRGPKTIILLALLIAAGSVLCLALPLGLWEMTVLRGMAGIGQGMLVIGVQSYILTYVSPEKKTQGMAIIVFGFQGGLISGMALGSLFVAFLSPNGVFAIAGGVGAAILAYSACLLPSSQKKATVSSLKESVLRLKTDLRKVVTDLPFLQTLLCIGAPAKAILTGVITFALPLVLGQLGYRAEDVGQIVMLYGLGVVASSGYVSRWVDRTKNTDRILFIGAVMSGCGLAAIGLINSPVLSGNWYGTALLIMAVATVGVAHGFINAPVVTHVGQSELSKRIGAVPVSTAYRFLERGGHVAGPLLLSQLFLLFGQGPNVISGFGILVAILGVAFVAHHLFPRSVKLHAEPAE
jgi:MFS family permease